MIINILAALAMLGGLGVLVLALTYLYYIVRYWPTVKRAWREGWKIGEEEYRKKQEEQQQEEDN